MSRQHLPRPCQRPAPLVRPVDAEKAAGAGGEAKAADAAPAEAEAAPAEAEATA